METATTFTPYRVYFAALLNFPMT